MKIAACITAAVLLTGCAFVSTRDAGRAVGNATYLAYNGVAARQDAKFREDVTELWRRVNALETPEQALLQLTPLQAAFNAVIAYPSLTDADRAALVHMRDLVVSRVVDEAGERIAWSSDAVEFLCGVRQGVNEMAELYAR